MTTSPHDPELAQAADAVRAAPTDLNAWEHLEAAAERAQAPEPVAELYVQQLSAPQPLATLRRLRERALRFGEEWFGDDAPHMQSLLIKAFEIDPSDDALFERLVVSLTAAGEWNALLDVHERALSATDSLERRADLLEEAVKIARDLAHDETRGLTLLRSLISLRPNDPTLRAQLERLLERSGRYHELVLSLATTDVSRPEPRADALARAAGLWLRELKSAPTALELVREVLVANSRHEAALAVAEELFASERTPAATRRAALELLGELYGRNDQPLEQARLLKAGADLYEGKERVRVQRELARILREAERGSEALEEQAEAFVRAPLDDTLLAELTALAGRFELDAPYAAALSRAARACELPARRHQLLLREAAVRKRLGETDAAIALYQRVLAQDDVPEAAREAGQELDRAFDAAGRLHERMAVLARLAALEHVDDVKRELLGALAKTALELGNEERALAAFRERLALDPKDSEALDGVIAIYEARREISQLIAALTQRAALVGGERGARDRGRIGRLYVEELKQLDEGLEAFAALHQEAPELVAELSLGDVLHTAASRALEDNARLATALADAYRSWLSDAERALTHYSRALASEPGHPEARAGLAQLLEDESVRARAADVLATAYATTDDVAALIELMPHRLASAASGAERARLLRQAAHLEVARRNAPERAFARACEALIEDPADASGDGELFRLAEQLGLWEELVEALHDAAVRLDPTNPRRGQLHVSEAEVSEHRLSDLPRALGAYQAASRALTSEVAVAEAICRVAAELGRYGDAFDVVISVADRGDQLADSLLAQLEQRALETGSSRALADAARKSFEHARLSAPTRRELMLRVADWYERQLQDPLAAESLLNEASRLGGPHAETLRRLAALQRRAPSRALFDSLVAAAELDDRELALLAEAAELARDVLHDDAREREVLERLVARGSTMLRGGQRSPDGGAPDALLIDAIRRLADKLSQSGEALAELSLLRDAATYPIAKESARAFAERAAQLALRTLGDSELAISLYQRALELAPNDPGLLTALSAEYDRRGKLDDLVVLRRRELASTMSVPRRLELRLELARVLGEIEARGGRLAALRENLEESPGHRESIEAVEKILRQQGALLDVYALLSHQALQLEAVGELAHAAELWRRAAELADRDLHDEDRALNAYQKLAGLEHDERALDALARIRLTRNEPGLAVPWIERSLEHRAASERAEVRLRLARAHRAAGNEDAAIHALEAGVQELPDSVELRDFLSDLYERNERYEALAELLADGATRAEDKATLLAFARRAATLFREKLRTPERSVDVLARAVAAQPDDRALQLEYVDALIAATRLDEAKRVLDDMVQEYGRRRSPERAELHLRLSRVAKARGEIEEALTQLDTAASMDRSHPDILRALGELALAAGQLERAERAYRTLLIIVRKPPTGVTPAIGASEVLYQLHRIALGLHQRDKAEELLESAVQTAVHSEAETARLKTLLIERGEPELLLRVLELRLSQVSSVATEAEVLSDLADVLETTLDRKDEAFEARLKALACAPELEGLHAATLRVAKALGRERNYVEGLGSLIERARRRDDSTLLSDLALRAGSLCEHELADAAAAATFYRQVVQGENGFVEAQFALARVSGRLGQDDEERAVLERIAALPEQPAYQDAKRGALYRLIELQVQRPESREQGLASLASLVEQQPDYGRAAHILKVAHEHAAGDARSIALLEQMARQSGDSRLLLDALERRAELDGAPLAVVREGAELARELGEGTRAEQLLKRAIELAEAGDGLAQATWAPLALGRALEARGEIEGALGYFERAMEVSEAEESFELGLELAQLAARHDRERAVRAYELLRSRDPADRRVWGPLLTFYRDAGELDRMLEIVETTLSTLSSQADRNALRIETARLMFEAEREQEGVRLLEAVLNEDPDHAEAALRLADLYERRGQDEQLVDLLSKKLESARERKSPSVIPLSLRMGALLAPNRPSQARSLYREALEIMPEDETLLRAAIEQTDPVEQGDERAELVIRYLSLPSAAEREQAKAYASWLVDFRAEQLDPGAFERALELAYRIAPEQSGLRARLLAWHRERNNHERLADLLESDAQRESDSARAVALLGEAVELRTQLGQRSEAAALLRRARELAPEDLTLLKRAVHASAASGELGPALGEIDAALEYDGRTQEERIELLLLRAEIAGGAGLHDEALASLTSAHALGGEAVDEALTRGLERARVAARERDDLARERELTLRLANTFHERGQHDRAIDTLEDWLSRSESDVQTMRVALELTSTAQRWGDALGLAEALCSLDEIHVLGHVSERLLEAGRGLGRPELARAGIERAYERAPELPELAELVEALYRELGDKQALARLLAGRISSERDPERRFEQLRRVAQLSLEVGDVDGAMGYLQEALEIKPDDLTTVMLVADAHIAAGRTPEARELIERTMGALRQRRGPELAALRLRMARLSYAVGDQQARYDWLSSALDADMNNGEVASELAVVAQETGQLDVALKALRALTMMKGEAPMSRAEAFFRQAIIVAQKGEPRRAVLWAKKAKAEDQHFPGVDRLIAELEAV